jgi:hypothetical protein
MGEEERDWWNGFELSERAQYKHKYCPWPFLGKTFVE